MGLQLAYFTLGLLMTVVLILFAKKAIDSTEQDQTIRRKKLSKIILGLGLWHMYIFGMGSSEILQNYSFPPRFVLFLIAPAFIFIGFFLRRNKKKEWVQKIPLSWLTFYQSFRIIIESIFVYSIARGIISNIVTFQGYNYDIVFAGSALIIGLLYYQGKLSEKFIFGWNILGLLVIAVIIFLFNSVLYIPHIFGPETQALPLDFAKYPYVLVPGFLMPSAVFIHFLSITQYRNRI